MTLRRIGLVAVHVFKESVRDRVLYAIGGFALLLVAASIIIGQLTAGQDVKIIKDLGLATIEVAGVLMTIFIGVGLVSREIERRSIYGLLAKPLPRWEFVIGKYFGLVLTILVNVSAMTAALMLMLAWAQFTSPQNVRESWDAAALDPRLLVASCLIFAELALLTAIALFFSTFSSSGLWSVVFTFGIFITGLSSQDLRNFGSAVDGYIVTASPILKNFVAAIGWIVPAFSAFSDRKDDFVHGIAVPAGYVMYTLVYAATYIAVAVGAATAVFSRREFK
jgi:ABC-type transport system involved in multi-copper enzyme maturation permease subunit